MSTQIKNKLTEKIYEMNSLNDNWDNYKAIKPLPKVIENIENLIKQIIDKPEEIMVNATSTTKAIVIQIKVAKEDIGKVIGKKGNTINALKLLYIVVKNTQFLGDTKDVVLEIIEDEQSNFNKNRKGIEVSSESYYDYQVS